MNADKPSARGRVCGDGDALCRIRRSSGPIDNNKDLIGLPYGLRCPIRRLSIAKINNQIELAFNRIQPIHHGGIVKLSTGKAFVQQLARYKQCRALCTKNRSKLIQKLWWNALLSAG